MFLLMWSVGKTQQQKYVHKNALDTMSSPHSNVNLFMHLANRRKLGTHIDSCLKHKHIFHSFLSMIPIRKNKIQNVLSKKQC